MNAFHPQQIQEQNMIQALALFSGGLDSILAARLIQEQGIRVRCVHFVTPFFGKPHLLDHWAKEYDLDIESIDISDAYIAMLQKGPENGYGKVLNPCIDCKILMMRHAKERMIELGARCIVSGEVVGQRPMSQRRDTLNLIARQGAVPSFLVRPLCAKHLKPTEPELSGLIDRERLGNMAGRGRTDQLQMAKSMGIIEIPTPGGGCLLTEKDHAKRYWPLLTHLKKATADDFHFANIGRQLWADKHWLAIGRNSADNMTLQEHTRPTDILLRVHGFPSPLGLARALDPTHIWSTEAIADAAAFLASYAPKAVATKAPVTVNIIKNGVQDTISIMPNRSTDLPWCEASSDTMRQGVRAWNQELGHRAAGSAPQKNAAPDPDIAPTIDTEPNAEGADESVA